MAETILLNIVKQLRPKQTEQIQNLQKTQADSTNYSLQKWHFMQYSSNYWTK